MNIATRKNKLLTSTLFLLSMVFTQSAQATTSVIIKNDNHKIRIASNGVKAALVNTKSKGIHKRQRKQARRINQGVNSGQLTAGETKRLVKQQTSIQRQKRRFKADGHFTKRERAIVHKRQNRASKNIYRKKHNQRTR